MPFDLSRKPERFPGKGENVEKQLSVKVYPVDIVTISNDYYVAFQKGMFKETIRINPESCVYRKWETTQYTLESAPNIFSIVTA